MIKSWLLGLILFLLTTLSFADSIETELSQQKISMGETLTVSYSVNTASRMTPDFSPLDKDFQILSTDYGNAINMVNGVTSSKSFWRVTLEPRRPGTLIIPEINFGTLKSTPQKIVVETGGVQVNNHQEGVPAFVEAKVNTTSPYVQSQVIYTFKLYYQPRLENPSIEIPQTKDATFVALGEGRQYETTLKGDHYYVLEKNFAFYPQKAGALSIMPFRFHALITDMNAILNPFYVTRPKVIALATPIFHLNVRAIPEKFVGNTWLPAKNLTLTEKWSPQPQFWQIGNPITRVITVEADGLRADQIPDLTIDKISNLNMYVDPPKRSNRVQGDTMIGVLEQKVTYIPTISQPFLIPAIKINWWNTHTNLMSSAVIKPVIMQIRGKISTPTPIQSTPVAKQQALPLQPKVKTNTITFYQSIWFWLAMFSFLLWALSMLFIWRKLKPTPVKKTEKSEELTEHVFQQACAQGNAALAQQFLLLWGKKNFHTSLLNLEELSVYIKDDTFKDELRNLQQALYAKSITAWDGNVLFTTYQEFRKSRKRQLRKVNQTKKEDLLPPLNPN